jgi:hypothetical protein
VDESVDGDCTDGDVEGGEHYKNVPSNPLAAEWSMLVFRALSFHQRATPSQSRTFFAFLLTGFRLSPMPLRHTPSPQ